MNGKNGWTYLRDVLYCMRGELVVKGEQTIKDGKVVIGGTELNIDYETFAQFRRHGRYPFEIQPHGNSSDGRHVLKIYRAPNGHYEVRKRPLRRSRLLDRHV